MMKEISVEEIQEILSNRARLPDLILNKRRQIFIEMENLEKSRDVLLESVCIKSPSFESMPASSHDHKDLFDVLEAQEKMIRKQIMDLKKELCNIAQFEEMTDRVWKCVRLLSCEYFDIIDRLYIKKETWEAIIYDLKLSKSVFQRKRNLALEQIQLLYQSERNTDELHLLVMKQEKIKAITKETPQKEHQVTLKELIENAV